MYSDDWNKMSKDKTHKHILGLGNTILSQLCMLNQNLFKMFKMVSVYWQVGKFKNQRL